MVGLHVMTTRHIRNPNTGLQALRDNPSLHIVRPATVPPTRLYNLATPDKSVPAIRHSNSLLKLQKKNRRSAAGPKPQISRGQRRQIRRCSTR